ncbi:MAG: hypothetical protein M3530_12190 [Thermoproteota archaeon]|nr:hypothetical protein [Thermoproteota archaeon]
MPSNTERVPKGNFNINAQEKNQLSCVCYALAGWIIWTHLEFILSYEKGLAYSHGVNCIESQE